MRSLTNLKVDLVTIAATRAVPIGGEIKHRERSRQAERQGDGGAVTGVHDAIPSRSDLFLRQG